MEASNIYSKIKPIKDLTVRQPTLEDIPAIVALSKLTHTEEYTTDYLPGWLPKMLQDQNRIVLVAEKHGQMVGFGIVLGGIGEGEYVIGESGRVHPDHQGMNVLLFLRYHLHLESDKRWPEWDRQLGSGTQTALLDKMTDQLKILNERMIVRVPLQNISTILAENTWHKNEVTYNIRPHTCEDFKSLLSTKATINAVYPDGFITIEHLIYKAVPSNAEHIHHYHEHIFSSTEPDDNVAVNAISIGGLLPCDDGRAWRYNFNYSGKVDIQLYLSHLRQHLHAAHKRGVYDKTVHLVLVMSMSLWESVGQPQVLQQVGTYLDVPEKNIVVLKIYITEYLHVKQDLLNRKKISSAL